MSRITKVVCDECKEEIKNKEWYFSADLEIEKNDSGVRRQIMNGDFCQECFKKIIKKELNVKED